MVYLVLDGPDGGGKSTQAQRLCGWLQQRGRRVHHLREPGSTPVGEALRNLLLSPATGELLPLSEVLLFTAARAELVVQTIAPALARGEDVIAERCFLSTLVYQSLALEHGIDFDWILDLTRRAHGACLPDAIYVLDLAVEESARRRRSRQDDRFEARQHAFHGRVRAAYLEVGKRLPGVEVVDASGSFDAVQDELRRRAARWLQ